MNTSMSMGNGFSRTQVHNLMTYGREKGIIGLTMEQAEELLADHDGDSRKAQDYLCAMAKQRKLNALRKRFTGCKTLVYLAPHAGAGAPTFHQVIASEVSINELEADIAKAGDGFVNFFEWREGSGPIEHRVRASSVWQLVDYDVTAHAELF